MRSGVFLICFIWIANAVFAQNDSSFIRVHFLYGSKPKKEYKHIEKKWFGGKLGGHAGVECGENGKILHFIFDRKANAIAKKNSKGKYLYNSYEEFYSILGGKMDSNKRVTVLIPCSAAQKRIFDSLAKLYTTSPPYDYAFIGMRCGSATYDILAQLDIFKQLGLGRTKMQLFYPRKTRKRVLKQAKKNNWRVERHEGNARRKWEMDR
jgi:hypothetical protein